MATEKRLLIAEVYSSSNEALPLHVDVLLARVQVSFLVFELFLEVRLERALEVLDQDLFVQRERMLYFSDVFEMNRVWDAQALHLVGMAPVLEVLLEGASAPVTSTTAYFTLKLLAEAMQFKKPVRNRFAVPSHRQVLWIILDLVFVVV